MRIGSGRSVQVSGRRIDGRMRVISFGRPRRWERSGSEFHEHLCGPFARCGFPSESERVGSKALGLVMKKHRIAMASSHRGKGVRPPTRAYSWLSHPSDQRRRSQTSHHSDGSGPWTCIPKQPWPASGPLEARDGHDLMMNSGIQPRGSALR